MPGVAGSYPISERQYPCLVLCCKNTAAALQHQELVVHPQASGSVYVQEGALAGKVFFQKSTENQNQTTYMQISGRLQNFINLGNNTCFEGCDLL